MSDKISKGVAPWDVVKVGRTQYVAVPVKLDESSDLCAGCAGDGTDPISDLCGELPRCSPGLASPCHLTFREVQIKGEQDDE